MKPSASGAYSPAWPVRQWVLSVPKRLRFLLQRDVAVLHMVPRIFLRVIAQSLQHNSPGAAQLDKSALHIGAIAFIHRFGSILNGYVHFHVSVADGVGEYHWTSRYLPFVAVSKRCSRAGHWQCVISRAERPQWRIRFCEWPFWSSNPEYLLLVDSTNSPTHRRRR